MLKESVTADRLSVIRLECLVPEVFADSDVSGSELWLADFSLRRGTHYLIEAGSGSGKSSLISYIYCSRRDFRGRITFDGRDSRSLSAADICRLRRYNLALLPQEMRLFGELSVMDNIMLKNRLTDYFSESEIRAMLERLEIDNKINVPAGRLSIGQMQRVALIRALCQPFDFLLLDEPVSHLDSRINGIAAAMVAEAATARDASVVVTSVGNALSLPADMISVIKL